MPRGSLEEASPSLLGSPDHWSDVRVASTSLLGLAIPNGPINSCNLQLCVHDLDDSGNKDFGCVL